MNEGIARRKQDHIDVVRERDVRSAVSAGWERYGFVHNALPELDLDEISLETVLFGKRLNAPLLISSMTGGTAETAILNRRMAAVAQRLGLAMGVGSQRIAIEERRNSHFDNQHFQVRDIAPDVLLFANLGAVQLNYGVTARDCRWLVESTGADALILHLNPLQEALQEGGDTRFAGIEGRIAALCEALPVPVVVKEVGWGISAGVAKRLLAAGVAAIDIAGAGGTSWSEVERQRATNPLLHDVAGAFAGWGIPTAEALHEVRAACPEACIIASVGIRDGIDVAKAIALGASLCGIAAPVVQAAARSEEQAEFALRVVIEQLRVAMFAVGVPGIEELRTRPGLLHVVSAPLPAPSLQSADEDPPAYDQ